MEHGAVTCTQAPKCSECAVRGHCAAYADVLRHTEGGGAPADAPPVTQYPTKVHLQTMLTMCCARLLCSLVFLSLSARERLPGKQASTDAAPKDSCTGALHEAQGRCSCKVCFMPF